MLQFYPDVACATLFRKAFLFVLFVCLLGQSHAQVFPVDSLMRNGNRSNRINFVYLSDGYQSADLSTFITKATDLNNSLFLQTPFKEYKSFFNAFAIEVPSVESDADHPHTAVDCPSVAAQPTINVNTYFNSTFDYFSIHRLLVPQNDAAVNSVLAANLPDYDQPFIVVNSPYYGGSGGVYATSSTNISANEIAIHEIGHSFAGLADEYWAGDAYAAELPNMTQNSNPATVKWKAWLGINGVGIYPYGASGTPAAWYRPHQSCKMQVLGQPFCSVCAQQFVDKIHSLVNMIDDYSPSSTSFTLTNTSDVAFSIANIETDPSTMSVNWYLNGSATPFATNQKTVSIPVSLFQAGSNQVKAEVVDNTTLSKTYLPGVGYTDGISWTVNKPASLPINLISFAGRMNNNAGVLTWELASAESVHQFELEKSNDGVSFASLASIAAQLGKNIYQYNDAAPFSPTSYYRLRIVEKNGNASYSNVLPLKAAFDHFSYKVYQQPEAKKYRLVVTLSAAETLSVWISDASGRQVLRKNFGAVNGQFSNDIELAGKPAGVYFFTVQIGDRQYTTQVLAK